MKKVLVVALAALLILALFIPAMAEDGPKFTTTVSATALKRGDVFTVKLVADKDFNTKGFGLGFSAINAHGVFEIVEVYDEEEEEMVKGIWSDAILKKVFMKSFNGNEAVFVYEKNRDIVAGDVITVKYKVKDDAAFGSYEMKIVPNELAPAGSTAVGATVTISHECVPATTYSHDAEGHWYACTVPGCTVAPTKTPHGWTGACDDLCDTCGETRTVTHDYSVQNKDTNNHWMECSSCHKVDESTKAAHIESADIPVTPADCANPAVYKKECTVCHIQIGANFNVGTPDASLHSGGTATCTAQAVCQHCHQAYGTVDANNHTGATKTEKNDTEHWTVCQSCTNEIAGTRAAHTGGTATCVDKKVCTVCAQAYGTVDPANHTGNKDVVPAEPSTCTTLGKKEGTKCHDCGEILSQEPETELAPHFVEEWTEVKPATETEEGEKKGKCIKCEQEFTVKTAKLAAALKPENVEAPQGSKVELGETKLPEDTGLDIGVLPPEHLTALEQNLGEFTKDIPEAAGKNVIAATSVMFVPNITFTDIASGDTVVDNDYQEKLPGKVKVTAPVPADLSNYENLVILLVEGEKVTKLNATIENGVVVYESDTTNGGIIVLGTQKKAPVVPETSTPAGEGAQTGDASQVVIFISLAIVSVLSLGGIYVSKKARASK